MSLVDLEPATRQIAKLIEGVPDGPLDGPTPCADYTLGDLIAHIDELAAAFTEAANKTMTEDRSQSPTADASRLGPDWRTTIPRALATLAEAWRDPAAWDGMAWIGGTHMPGQVVGAIAVDEVVLHGWDLARATGQDFEVDPALAQVAYGFVSQLKDPQHAELRARVFGPEVPVGADEPLFVRLLGMAGRDPDWSPES